MTARRDTAGISSKYWLLQAVLWPLYAAVRFGATLPIIEADERWAVALLTVLRTAIGAAVSVPLMLMCRAMLSRERSAAAVIVAAAAGSYGLGIVWMVADRLLNTAVATRSLARVQVEWRGIGVDPDVVLALLVAAASYALVWSWDIAARHQQYALAHAVAARDARLRSLTAQLRPHFLINALAGVRGVIAEDAERARDMVTAISRFLGATMTAPELHSLADELALAETFLEIERFRFERAIVLDLDVAVDARRCQVPAFVLQPLVENAAQHGRPCADGVRRIRIAAKRDGRLFIEIANPGRLDGYGAGTGVGTENVRDRLAQAANSSFTLAEDAGWVVARVTLEARDV